MTAVLYRPQDVPELRHSLREAYRGIVEARRGPTEYGDSLDRADCFWVAPPMLDLAHGLATTLRSSEIDVVPVAIDGFMVFGVPFDLGLPEPVAGFTWTTVQDGDGYAFEVNVLHEIHVAQWRAGFVPHRITIGGGFGVGSEGRVYEIHDDLSYNPVEKEHPHKAVWHTLARSWALMLTPKYAERTIEYPDRAARRRLARAGADPDVRIIVLRSIRTLEPHGGTHESPALHNVRRYPKRQRYGPGNSLVKTIWVEECERGDISRGDLRGKDKVNAWKR